MNFHDRAIIVSKRILRENSAIITVLTENNGLYSGVIKQSKQKFGDSLMAGNMVDFWWQARLHEHIGLARCELVKTYSTYFIQNKTKLYAVNSIMSLLQTSFHEREPHNNIFSMLLAFLDELKRDFQFCNYIKMELGILAEAGYKLQLDRCAVTGKTSDLYYVSPKSGAAVTYEVGKPYENKLLILPKFLAPQAGYADPATCATQQLPAESQQQKLAPGRQVLGASGTQDRSVLIVREDLSTEATTQVPAGVEFKAAIELTSYFFDRYIFHHKEQPRSRKVFLEHALSL